MRKVKRWRFYCDYCKKAGGSGGHILRHEKHCTLNPNRVCNVCGSLLELEQKPMSELLVILPNGKDFCSTDKYGFISYIGLENKVEEVMPKLRELTEGCPACIMAALRQANIPVLIVESFSFRNEMTVIFDDINKSRSVDEEAGYYL